MPSPLQPRERRESHAWVDSLHTSPVKQGLPGDTHAPAALRVSAPLATADDTVPQLRGVDSKRDRQLSHNTVYGETVDASRIYLRPSATPA